MKPLVVIIARTERERRTLERYMAIRDAVDDIAEAGEGPPLEGAAVRLGVSMRTVQRAMKTLRGFPVRWRG